VYLDWGNIGKKPARRSTATLFTVSQDWKQREKIGVQPIIAGGTNVLPGTNGHAEFLGVDMQRFLGAFLVCVTYFDEAGTVYEQTFLYRLGAERPNEQIIPLNEEMTPDNAACRASN
jgi:hypothetical protein